MGVSTRWLPLKIHSRSHCDKPGHSLWLSRQQLASIHRGNRNRPLPQWDTQCRGTLCCLNVASCWSKWRGKHGLYVTNKKQITKRNRNNSCHAFFSNLMAIMASDGRKSTPGNKINSECHGITRGEDKMQPSTGHNQTVSGLQNNMYNLSLQALDISKEIVPEIIWGSSPSWLLIIIMPGIDSLPSWWD